MRNSVELRAYHVPSNRMFDVTTISFVKEQIWGKSKDNITISDIFANFVLMEKSGISDKNNVPLYEDDIVWNEAIQEYGIVTAEPTMFVIKYIGNVNIILTGPRVFEKNKMDITVVGNIFQNSNILKGGEKSMDGTQDTQAPAPQPVEEAVVAPAETSAPAEQPAVESSQPEVASEVVSAAPEVPAEEPATTEAPSRLDLARERLNDALVLLRAERDEKSGGVGSRELSKAITDIEQGSMWINRSPWADTPYDPRTKLQKVV